MNNQTIDGVLVPRELAKRLAVPMLRTPEYLFDHRDALDELRALLDAPAAPVTPCAIADALEASQWPNTSIGNKVLVAAAITELRKAARPQGEPVAWQHRVTAGPQTGWSLWAPGRGKEYAEHYTVEVRPLYAEQPAPVAGVLPERLNHAQGLHTYEYVTGHNAAIDKMLGKSEKEQDHGKP